jgi:hypothetical protein
MIERPKLPPSEIVQTPADALDWLQSQAAGVR